MNLNTIIVRDQAGNILRTASFQRVRRTIVDLLRNDVEPTFGAFAQARIPAR